MSDAPIPERLAAAFEGRYRLIRELGQGGMATVYLAEDLKHDRQVAIKVLRPELAAVIGGERFVAEIKTTAGLQHPHILPLFDSGEIDGFLFYVMPYVEGETLRDRLDRERQLGVDDALRITRDVADALDYAHRQGVIHRDIKPENILLHDGRPVVADFGIAVAISAAGGGRMTETGLSLGTPHYMSPEQATADRDLTVRSDVYSLSCVLYEMLAGDPPHTGPSAQAILVRILTEAPRPVTDTRTSVPPHVAAVLAKGLEKLPADRFDSAAEFRAALDRTDFVYSPTERPADGPAGRPAVSGAGPGHAARARGPVAALGVAVALLAAVAAWGWLRPAAVPVRPVTYDLEVAGWTLEGDFRIAVSPDGRYYAAVGRAADSTAESDLALLIRPADEPSFRMLTDEEVSGFPVFSPDSRWVVYATEGADAGIRRIPVDGGQSTVIMQEDGIDPAELAWSDDGYIYFFGVPNVWRVAEAGGEPEIVLEGATWAWEPTPLPGGRGLLVTDSRTDPVSLAVLDFETDSLRTLIREATRATWVRTGHLVYGHPDGGLQAVPFDLERLEVTGTPIPVQDGVSANATVPFYEISSAGTLVYTTGRAGTSLTPDAVLTELDFASGESSDLDAEARPYFGIDYHPAGDRVAFGAAPPGGRQDASQIYTWALRAGTEPRQWTSGEAGHVGPVWNPSGDRIAYVRRESQNTSSLWSRSTVSETEAIEWVPVEDGAYLYEPDWASDSVLVYARWAGTPPTAWRVDEGGVPGRAFESDEVVDDPTVSSAGDRLAYTVLDTFDEPEVVVRPYPGMGPPVRVSVGGGVAARWHPSGESIFFLTEDRQYVYAVKQAFVTRAPVFAVDSVRVLAEDVTLTSYDVHPSGDRMIYSRPVTDTMSTADEETERHIVVLNWLEGLEERLGR